MGIDNTPNLRKINAYCRHIAEELRIRLECVEDQLIDALVEQLGDRQQATTEEHVGEASDQFIYRDTRQLAACLSLGPQGIDCRRGFEMHGDEITSVRKQSGSIRLHLVPLHAVQDYEEVMPEVVNLGEVRVLYRIANGEHVQVQFMGELR